MSFDTILFDLDGTLTDSKEGIVRSVVYALDKLSCPVPPEATLQKFVGPPLLFSLTTYCGLSEARAKEGIEWYRERFSTVGLYENSVYEGIIPMLKRLKSAGKQLVVATSKPELFSIKILEHFALAPYFSCIAGAGMDETRTSKPEVIAYTLEKCGVADKRNAVMVGDRVYDIDGAKQNGLYSIGVLYGYGDRDELESAGADAIVSTVDELSAFLSAN